jgi:hypothetical protein
VNCFLSHSYHTTKTNHMATPLLFISILKIRKIQVHCWFELNIFSLLKKENCSSKWQRNDKQGQMTSKYCHLNEQVMGRVFCPDSVDLKSKNYGSETMTEKLCAHEIISSKLNICASDRSSCFVIQQSENQWALCGNVP